ncbi:MAG: hypothetical protein C0484_04155 [Rhodospirillum sp.]|nr:hypothetical protein [Rhodospirillum sp.]
MLKISPEQGHRANLSQRVYRQTAAKLRLVERADASPDNEKFLELKAWPAIFPKSEERDPGMLRRPRTGYRQ